MARAGGGLARPAAQPTRQRGRRGSVGRAAAARWRQAQDTTTEQQGTNGGGSGGGPETERGGHRGSPCPG
jgi:hypothetical protein